MVICSSVVLCDILVSVFFFCVNRRPRRPTLFPYTTLFRSERVRVVGDLGQVRPDVERVVADPGEPLPLALEPVADLLDVVRSEEHTSELQSLRHLVCRLLLEKKRCDQTCSWHRYGSCKCYA